LLINGYKHPRIITVSQGKQFIYELNLTNSKGLVETYEFKKLEHELISLADFNDIEILQKMQGFRIYWTLNYDEFISGEDMLTLKQILEDALAGNKIILVPRVDFPLRNFEVIVSSSGFELGISKGGEFASHNRLPVIRFVTKKLEPDLKWFTPGEKQNVTMVNNESIKMAI